METTLGPVRGRKWSADSFDSSLDQHGDFWYIIGGIDPTFRISGMAFVCPLSYKQGDLEVKHRHYWYFGPFAGDELYEKFIKDEPLDNLPEAVITKEECRFRGQIIDGEWRLTDGSERTQYWNRKTVQQVQED